MTPRPIGLLLVPAVIATAALSPGSAGDAGVSRADRVVRVVTHDVPLDPDLERRVRLYWTPQRMTATENAATRVPTSAMVAASVSPTAAVAARAAQVAETASAGALWTAGGLVARTTGKVFFTIAGRDFLCSASTVQSANKDVVVTAGHCVKAGRGAWADNWIFVPGYREGGGPYGGFTARRMFTPDPWSQGGDGEYDVAMVAVSPSDGRHVVDLAGGQRIAFGGPSGRRTYTFGYPSAGGYDGEHLAYCSGRSARDPRGETAGRGLRCDLTKGSSGGPWLSGFDPATGAGVVTSVSSFKFADDHRTMYGPKFGDAVRRIYERAQSS